GLPRDRVGIEGDSKREVSGRPRLCHRHLGVGRITAPFNESTDQGGPPPRQGCQPPVDQEVIEAPTLETVRSRSPRLRVGRAGEGLRGPWARPGAESLKA